MPKRDSDSAYAGNITHVLVFRASALLLLLQFKGIVVSFMILIHLAAMFNRK